MAFIAGPYTWTFGTPSGPVGAARTLGVIEDAPTLELVGEVQPIIGDNLGSTLQDGVFRGGNCFLSMILQEYNADAAKYAFAPYTAEFGEVGCVGALMSNYADALVGTPLAPLCTLGSSSVPPGVADPESTKLFTGFKAVLAPGFPIRMLLGSRLRNVPIRFQLLPYTENGVKKFFKFANP